MTRILADAGYECGLTGKRRLSGRYNAGPRTDALVELVDLAPTLLEAAGIPVPEGMQGRPLPGPLRQDADAQAELPVLARHGRIRGRGIRGRRPCSRC